MQNINFIITGSVEFFYGVPSFFFNSCNLEFKQFELDYSINFHILHCNVLIFGCYPGYHPFCLDTDVPQYVLLYKKEHIRILTFLIIELLGQFEECPLNLVYLFQFLNDLILKDLYVYNCPIDLHRTRIKKCSRIPRLFISD